MPIALLPSEKYLEKQLKEAATDDSIVKDATAGGLCRAIKVAVMTTRSAPIPVFLKTDLLTA